MTTEHAACHHSVGLGLFILGSIYSSSSVRVHLWFWHSDCLGPSSAWCLLFKRRSVSRAGRLQTLAGLSAIFAYFSEMERHEIPSLILWEHYLVYAVTLGVAKEVIKQLELVFPNLQEGDYRFGYGWLTYETHSGMSSLPDSFNDIGEALENSIRSAQKAVSKSSSGSGGGGGFSGGGGGGGGGSSYGGR